MREALSAYASFTLRLDPKNRRKLLRKQWAQSSPKKVSSSIKFFCFWTIFSTSFFFWKIQVSQCSDAVEVKMLSKYSLGDLSSFTWAVLFSLLYTIVVPSWESYDSFQPSVKKRFSMQYDYSYLWWLLMCKHTTFLKTFKSRFSNEHIFQTHKFRKKTFKNVI